MFNVAYVIQDLEYGGIPTFLMNLAKELKGKFTFHFIATENPTINPSFYELGRAAYIGDNDGLVGYFKKHKISLVQYGNVLNYKTAALKAAVPVIVERTAGPRSCNLDRTGVTHVISSTQGTVPLIRKNYSGPLSVIYNGIDFDRFSAVAPDFLDFSPDDFIICYCARMGGVGQGFEDLVRAVVEIHKEKDVKLVLIGDKPEKSAEDIRPRLRKLAKPLGKDCVFTGALKYPAPVMAAANLYVCPAKHHGISNSLIEAAALGLPIVATAVGQTSEIVHHGKNGNLVPPGHLSSLTNNILHLMGSPAKRMKFSNYGRELVRQEFNVKIQAAKYLELYNKLLSNI